MYNAMTAMNPAISLWFIAAIIIGNYILLNLFLAILLENFSTPSASDGSGSRTSRTNSNGSTMAAAVKMAVIYDWLQDLLESSWFARMLRSSNKVHAETAASGDWGATDADVTTHRHDADASHSPGMTASGPVRGHLDSPESFGSALAPPADSPYRYDELPTRSCLWPCTV